MSQMTQKVISLGGHRYVLPVKKKKYQDAVKGIVTILNQFMGYNPNAHPQWLSSVDVGISLRHKP